MKMPKKCLENIDRTPFLAYNRRMGKKENTKTKYFLWGLRGFLTLACLLLIAFIFTNSLQEGEQSAEKSSEVVKAVQKVAAFFDPNSVIATATGEAYDRLHAAVRNWAHFAEFALLGGLLCWCCFSYTFKKIFQIIPPCAVALVAVTDEILQLFTSGRAFQVFDILLDCGGGIVGIGFAILTVWLGVLAYKKKKQAASLEGAMENRVGEEE